MSFYSQTGAIFCTIRQRKGQRREVILFCQFVLLVGLAGCGGQGMSGCEVSGRVTINGDPLPHGLIMFLPEQHAEGLRTVSAEIVDGAFSIPPSSRLAIGSYKVAITADKKTGRKIVTEEKDGHADEHRQYIPPKYNARTTLSAEISGDTDILEFPLELRQKR